MKTFIIAEAGVNHNGSLELAKKLVDAAINAGADCIKFQTFKAEKLVSTSALKAEYQTRNSMDKHETQYEMLKKVELSYEDFIILKNYCDDQGIEFLSTSFDLESTDFLATLGVSRWKIPSGEITNLPYLEKIAQFKQPVILSTGMSEMDDIRNALEVFRRHENYDVTILHCTSEYPAPINEVNLNAMSSIKTVFNTSVGYSDHTEGIEIPIAAVSLGATIIEKHFTLDRTLDGPDHKASIEPNELKRMIDSIRKVEASLGDGVKRVTESERKNRSVVRKSIVAQRKINKGEILSTDNLSVKRPGNGISPMQWYEVLGSEAIRDFDKDEMIEV
jgi:N,N'-diacetyllegionaminate synthase